VFGVKRAYSDYMTASVQMGHMLVEAQMVIAMRLMGFGGFWRLGPGEEQRMWAEKLEAAQQSGAALAGALMAGATPARAVKAAIKPIRARTKSNVRRLAGRGPKTVG